MTIASVPLPASLDIDTGRIARNGRLGLAVLLGVVMLWAATTSIGGAVITQGQVMVEGRPKLVQSLEGGTISELAVKEGDVVLQGQLLLHLDPTLLQVNLDIARSRLAAALALQARLIAEQTQRPTLEFAYPDLPVALPDTTPHEAGQHAIFTARTVFLDGARDRLDEVFAQFDNQILGVEGQTAATLDQLTYIDADLENMRKMAKQQLVRQSALSQMEQSRAELAGRLAGLEAERARLVNARHDSELATLQTERSFMENVVTELRDTTAQIEELMLEITTRTAQLARTEIRAPAAGVVHELTAGSVGGVVAPGGDILQIIPLDERLEFELRVNPQAIDQVYLGQDAQVMMVSFDPQTTPKLNARVTRISPNTIADPRTGQNFYRVNLSITPEELTRLREQKPVPGMPIEAYLKTGDRTVLTYLLHPVTAHLRRAFRE